MSDTTLRDAVWAILDDVEVGDDTDELYAKADRIIAMFRERMTSEAAVEAGCRAYCLRTGQSEAGLAYERWPVYKAITAALTVALGADDAV